MSSKCKSYSHYLSKNISIYAIFDGQSFNDRLTNNIVSFEQMCPPDDDNVYFAKNGIDAHILFLKILFLKSVIEILQ